MEPLVHLCPKIDKLVNFPTLFYEVLKSRQITLDCARTPGITQHRAVLAEKQKTTVDFHQTPANKYKTQVYRFCVKGLSVNQFL